MLVSNLIIINAAPKRHSRGDSKKKFILINGKVLSNCNPISMMSTISLQKTFLLAWKSIKKKWFIREMTVGKIRMDVLLKGKSIP